MRDESWSRRAGAASAWSALLLLCAWPTVGCELLVREAVKEALKKGEYGEACKEDGSCEPGLVCVQALAVDPGQDEEIGYRCLHACDRHAQCAQFKHQKTCCAMMQRTQTSKACFQEQDELCLGPIIEPP